MPNLVFNKRVSNIVIRVNPPFPINSALDASAFFTHTDWGLENNPNNG